MLVSDMKKSIKFYSIMLGTELKHKTEDRVESSKQDIALALQQKRKWKWKNNSTPIGFKIGDIVFLSVDLEKKQVKFYKKLAVGPFAKNAIIEDPDGYLISCRMA